jgi:uncharacterized protein (TIGR02594 family)
MTPFERARADIGSGDGAAYLALAGWEHLGPKADWCSAAMRVWHRASEVDLPHITPAARSWMNVGEEVTLENASPGDVAVLWRGKPGGWQGHVAFLAKALKAGEDLLLLGGNQRGSVCERAYPLARLLGIRRISSLAPPSPK